MLVLLRRVGPAFIALALSQPVLAQDSTMDQLRREVDRLVRENRELRTRATDAEARVAELEAEIRALRDQLAAVPAEEAADIAPDPDEPPAARPRAEPSAPIPLDPLASPASLLRELKRHYRQEVAVLPRGSDADNAAYMDALRKWCRAINRDLRGRTTWVTRVEGIRIEESGESSALLTIIEPRSLLPIGESFRVSVPERFLDRVTKHEQARPKERSLWKSTVLFIADPRQDETRDGPGVYDYPPYIGPYAEFRFQIEWIGLAPAGDEAEGIPEPTRRNTPR